MRAYARVCVCARVRVCACARVCVYVCASPSLHPSPSPSLHPLLPPSPFLSPSPLVSPSLRALQLAVHAGWCSCHRSGRRLSGWQRRRGPVSTAVCAMACDLARSILLFHCPNCCFPLLFLCSCRICLLFLLGVCSDSCVFFVLFGSSETMSTSMPLPVCLLSSPPPFPLQTSELRV